MARIIGTNENDILHQASRGRDVVYGLDGDDQIHLGSGDTAIGGAGADTFMVSESGTFTLSYAGSDAPVNFRFYNNDDVPPGEQVAQLDVSGGDAAGDRLVVHEQRVHVEQKVGVIGTSADDYFEGEMVMVEGGAGADTIVFDHRDVHSTLIEPGVAYGSSNEAVYFDQDSMTGFGGHADGDRISFVGEEESGDLNRLNVRGSNHDDILVAGEDREGVLLGAGGDDLLIGSSSGNELNGEWGNDVLLGHGGDDTLTGGSGADFMDGGDGIDEVQYQGSSEAVEIDLRNGTANGGDAEGDVIRNVENITGSQHHDVLIGDDGNNVIDGFFGIDTIYGHGGDDTLSGAQVFGGDGDDILYGRQHGMDGQDILDGGDGDDIIYGNDEGDSLIGGEGDDILIANNIRYDDFFEADRTYLYGNAGNDKLYGDVANDHLYGGDDRDHMYGGSGNDWLHGENGHDVLYGEAGNDRIQGGDGNDLMTGGGGQDDFIWTHFEGGAERDRITDFQAGGNGDRVLLGKTFQQKSGIDDFDDFIAHAQQNDTGVYIDFADGQHYGYGVQIDGIEIADLVEGNVVFEDI
ncbi:MAG: calcium-binding protein [Pseudomonadota bacterium]